MVALDTLNEIESNLMKFELESAMFFLRLHDLGFLNCYGFNILSHTV